MQLVCAGRNKDGKVMRGFGGSIFYLKIFSVLGFPQGG
jgi:hypothetical protein